MSYQVIARKWRPQAFDEVTGQDHITHTLRNAIVYERLHHAYLFSGARGVGKTTTARLLAKALNCHTTETPNPKPCPKADGSVCHSCLEISESRSIDVFEFDAASHTGVDDIRDIILENINVAPARDRYKVFIIDEVHMLSNSSFNALLKTVEEPPPNVVFIMATTELHKVPDTILSRCQEFQFRTIPQQQIFERLKLIAEAEKIDIADEALRVLARSGEGSMRDAQSNFDQVISYSGEKIAVSDVTSALGMAGSEMIAKIVTAIADSRSKSALDVVADLIAGGHDLRNFCRDLLGLFRDLLIFKLSGDDISLVESSILNPAELAAHAERFTEGDLIRFFHSLAETESKLKEAMQSRYVLEIGLVKLIEMRRVTPLADVIERLARLESGQSVLPAEQAAAAPEKKTLIPEIDAADVPDNEAPADFPPEIIDEAEAEPALDAESLDSEEITTEKYSLDFVNSLPVKLPPISSEELEHIDDKWLDPAYEEKLLRSGDDLFPLNNAAQLAAAAIGTTIVAGSNGTARVAITDPTAYAAPVYEPDDASPLPDLSENPTEEEMLKFASAHPAAKLAMRLFRARIVAVSKR